MLLLMPALLISACARVKSARRARIERHLEVAKVFESREPYSTRTIGDSALSHFLAKNAEYRADSADITDFYAERHNQFAWILGDSISENAEAFVALSGVDDSQSPSATKGTRRLSALYNRGIDEGKLIPLCDSCATELELRLTGEYYRYVNRTNAGDLKHDLNTIIPAAKRDYGRLLDSLVANKMDLEGYEPANPQYKLLKEQVQKYSKFANTPWPALEFPAGKKRIKVGDSTAVVSDIGARLRILGDLEKTTDSTTQRYDTAMATGVKHFQSRHGMHPDGVIDSDFLNALNISPVDRIRTMLVNMERMRWSGDARPANLLRVNIPEFRLHVIQDSAEVLTMDVVVGARGTHTTIFSDTMTTIVMSPPWDVPSSIVHKEVLPGIAKNANYLAKHDMQIIGGSKDDPQVRQMPGATNSLGRVKFLFPNSFDIYMHDTPAKSLFDNEDRAASHGCIRLAHAEQLADFLLKDDSNWPPDKIHDAMFSGNTQMVKLAHAWPVSIEYFTAWVDRDGTLQFRNDVYGHDASLAGELFSARQAAATPAQ
ncbi:MAG TPA: L,D-transpeptidase family protein [Gemmatimonadaceae bacterium]|nr:L,D-transpeptidase family protein [Gemmatimonadaceae bacterium]